MPMRLLLLGLVFACSTCAASVSRALQPLVGTDTACAVWVAFVDKPGWPGVKQRLAPAALTRRRRAGFAAATYQDAAVWGEYVARVEALGGRLRHTFRWANAASFDLPMVAVTRVASLRCVARVLPVRRYERTRAPGGLPKTGRIPREGYGAGLRQAEMIRVPLCHEYLMRHKGVTPGEGVLIGLFDTGFWLGHRCFGHVLRNDAVVADSDFVDRDGDPTIHSHGAWTMSLIGGYDPQYLVGGAWGARFVLARTEDDGPEYHAEEDNWAAAIVWAESLGVEVINSSLGYRYDYTAPDTDYVFADMDGKTTIVARATEGALARGVVIVSSMGNDGVKGPGSINSPADAADVVAVGSVDGSMLLSEFSSLGPTADGRTKPDLVAMGSDVVAIAMEPDSYFRYSGTSFTAPMVTGIVAMARQLYPQATAAGIVDRLYGSCRFTPYQDSVDNAYGRGLPDALLACLGRTEAFLVATDSLGNRVGDVVVRDPSGNVLAVTDTGWSYVYDLSGETLPVRFQGALSGGDSVSATVDSVPAYVPLVFGIRRTISVAVRSTSSGGAVAGARVYWRPLSSQVFRTVTSDDSGMAVVHQHSSDGLELYASAPGHLTTGTTTLHCEASRCTLDMAMTEEVESRFVVYPNVVSRSRGETVLTVEFVHERNERPMKYTVSVRDVTGALVWRRPQEETVAHQPLQLNYDCRNQRGRLLVPGTYFFIVECAGKARIKKFLITG